MARIINIVFSVLDIIFLIVCLFVIIVAVNIRMTAGGVEACVSASQINLILMGSAITFMLAFMGLIALCRRASCLMHFYLFLTFLWIIICVAFLIFLSLLTTKTDDAKTYDTNKGPHLINYFVHGKKWEQVRLCMIQIGLCDSLINGDSDLNHSSPMQSGCCLPPPQCGLTPLNTTVWIAKERSPAAGQVADSDCLTWSNQQAMLCYNCNSCKGQVIKALREPVRTVRILIACMLFIFTVIYILGAHLNIKDNNSILTYEKHETMA